eukprot:m.118251 g.118251  ORF g.118251 m.118251 type:complete len:102 (+) comp16113_c1_seq19:109-414(+)
MAKGLRNKKAKKAASNDGGISIGTLTQSMSSSFHVRDKSEKPLGGGRLEKPKIHKRTSTIRKKARQETKLSRALATMEKLSERVVKQNKVSAKKEMLKQMY